MCELADKRTLNVSSDNYSSVCVHNGKIFAAIKAKQVEVHVFEPTIKKRNVTFFTMNAQRSLKLHRHVKPEAVVTLAVSNENLVCCSREDNKILMFSLHGWQMQPVHMTTSGEAGSFSQPYICCTDGRSDVLIADHGNNRLQVMTSDGRFSVLRTSFIVEQPRAATFHKNSLVIVSTHESHPTLVKMTGGGIF